jgi:hypothetical protein
MALQSVGRFGVLIGGGVIALGSTIPLSGAQATPPRRNASPPATSRNDAGITVRGCLLLGPYGDYTLSETIVAPDSAHNVVAWKLEANEKLLKHVLENVEVTGTMMRTRSDAPRGSVVSPGRGSTDRTGTATYRLRVKTIRKMIGGCSK